MATSALHVLITTAWVGLTCAHQAKTAGNTAAADHAYTHLVAQTGRPRLIYIMEYDMDFDWQQLAYTQKIQTGLVSWVFSLRDRLTVSPHNYRGNDLQVQHHTAVLLGTVPCLQINIRPKSACCMKDLSAPIE